MLRRVFLSSRTRPMPDFRRQMGNGYLASRVDLDPVTLEVSHVTEVLWWRIRGLGVESVKLVCSCAFFGT
jgi:hypothetical protein